MKRVIAWMVMVMLVVCLASPVFAAEFVPSITDKNSPDVVPGEEGAGALIDAQGNVVGYINNGDLIITPVSQVNDANNIPEESKEALEELYNGLLSGESQLPFPSDVDPDDMVIRDLFDVTVSGEGYEVLDQDGVGIKVTFDLGIDADTDIHGFIHIDGQWIPLTDLVNNGDGTVTVTLPGEGQVAFAVPADTNTTPDPTGDPASITLWVVLMAVSAVALVVVVFSRRKIVG